MGDQDERLWKYIRSQVLDEKYRDIEDPLTETPRTSATTANAVVNGRKNSEEEEIDDDEDTALKEEQEEIDDDEENALSIPKANIKSPAYENSYVRSEELPKSLEA